MNSLKILLIGNTGQLGWELERCLVCLGEVIAVDFPAINLSDPGSAASLIREHRPNIVINASAYTAVNRAESEPDLVFAINTHAPAIMAIETKKIGAAFIHFSTDYVFDGEKGSPYIETDEPKPLGVYGLSKLQGEQAIQDTGGANVVLRTSWVYSLRRDNFISKVLSWSRQQPTLKLVTDQVSGPTWSRHLAEITTQVLARASLQPIGWLNEHRGIFHLAGSGYCSRWEWGKEILKLDPHPEEQVTRVILPGLTADFPTPACRPLFSALDCTRFTQTFQLKLPDWQISLRQAMEAL